MECTNSVCLQENTGEPGKPSAGKQAQITMQTREQACTCYTHGVIVLTKCNVDTKLGYFHSVSLIGSGNYRNSILGCAPDKLQHTLPTAEHSAQWHLVMAANLTPLRPHATWQILHLACMFSIAVPMFCHTSSIGHDFYSCEAGHGSWCRALP